MVRDVANRKIVHRFEVQIEQTDEEENWRRYWASCVGLSGCSVYASSKTKALRKIRQAIDVWLDLANRQLTGQEDSMQDMIDWRVPD